MRPVTVIGAATSAGTHYAGQERAPDAMRAAGLIERLVRAGITVTDHGKVVRDTFRVDTGHPRARNLAATVRAAQTVADAVEFAAPALSAVVLTEVNPSYDPSGDSLDRYLEAVAGALITGLAG